MVVVETAISEVREKGFCVLKACFALRAVQRSSQAFEQILHDYLEEHREEPNRGPKRHFLPMPFHVPCFQPEFFFNAAALGVVRGVMDNRVAADQWGCDLALKGSIHQQAHVDYQRPLFAEDSDLSLPAYMLVVSFGLADITRANGPLEIAQGTHKMPRNDAFNVVAAGEVAMQPVLLDAGDVLIRHPWALHRGSPNMTDTPRALLTIRYVRRWYADFSREVNAIPRKVWESFTTEQRELMRFPVARD